MTNQIPRLELLMNPSAEQLDHVERSNPRTVARKGDTYTIVYGPPLPRQSVEFCALTATHLRDEAQRKPSEREKLLALAEVYDRRAVGAP